MLVTKWRKFKYSGFTKSIVGLLILAGGTVFIWCLIWFAIYGDTTREDFADSSDFSQHFMSRVHNVAELNSELKSIEHINELTESQEERIRLYKRYNLAQNNLDNTPNFLYKVVSLETGEVVHSNLDTVADNILNLHNHVYFSNDEVVLNYGSQKAHYELSDYLGYVDRHDTRYYGSNILAYLAKENYALYAGIRDNLVPEDIF